MRFILDTDVFVDLIRKYAPATEWICSLPRMPYLSGIASLEASFGARSVTDLKEVEKALEGFVVLWPSEIDMESAVYNYGRLRLTHGIGSLDAVAAALAIRHGMPLATFNIKHFRAIPGLVTVQPYER